MDAFEVPVVDLSDWVGGERGSDGDCIKLAQALHVSRAASSSYTNVPNMSFY